MLRACNVFGFDPNAMRDKNGHKRGVLIGH